MSSLSSSSSSSSIFAKNVGIKDLLVGEAETVGVRYIPGRQNAHPPLRIYYPASQKQQQPEQRTSLFAPEGYGFFLTGYLHVIGCKHGTWLHRYVLSPLLTMVGASLSFLSYYNVPLCLQLHAPAGVLTPDAPPIGATTTTKKKKKYPLIVFSHGLSGTGHENTLLHLAWAKLGFVVVSVHHTDGSSARVRLYSSSLDDAADNDTTSTYEDRYYEHGPSFQNYDPNFRPNQIQKRANDLKQAVGYVTKSKNTILEDDLSSIIDTDTIILSGFSYGAATAALAMYNNPGWFDNNENSKKGGLILLDGWFYIDVMKSAGVEFEFPSQVFEHYRQSKEKNGNTIPSVFINSQQFSKYPKLYKATCDLEELISPQSSGVEKSGDSNMHVLEGTTHQNFVDMIWWGVPLFLLQKLKVIGPMDARDAYQNILHICAEFLKKNFQ
mmetsp:Transcript_19094/g.29075  ORF Transcript_19094/g.29075 Transcript_19094/m.29075 type:complete len:438 (-) Transcript_19094:23-1336(-)